MINAEWCGDAATQSSRSNVGGVASAAGLRRTSLDMKLAYTHTEAYLSPPTFIFIYVCHVHLDLFASRGDIVVELSFI